MSLLTGFRKTEASVIREADPSAGNRTKAHQPETQDRTSEVCEPPQVLGRDAALSWAVISSAQSTDAFSTSGCRWVLSRLFHCSQFLHSVLLKKKNNFFLVWVLYYCKTDRTMACITVFLTDFMNFWASIPFLTVAISFPTRHFPLRHLTGTFSSPFWLCGYIWLNKKKKKKRVADPVRAKHLSQGSRVSQGSTDSQGNEEGDWADPWK